MGCTKGKDILWPASTCADRQSPPELLPWGRWRDTLNVLVDGDDAFRRGGWTRWGAEFEDVEDPDLHGIPVTTLYSWSQSWGNRILLAGSTSGVYRWSPGSGVWSSISGVPTLEAGERRSFAALGSTCIIAGGLGGATAEGIRSYTIGDAGATTVPDLVTLEVSSANFVAEWRGVVFLLDVVMEGVRVGHRVLWSARNNPLSYVPETDSIAGFQDLDLGEFILGAAVSGDSLYILTDRSIWRVIATGDEEVFRFQQVYKSETGQRCLWAPYTLDVLPDGNMIYVGDGGKVYIYSPYQPAPTETDWLSVGTTGLRKRTGACRLFSGKVCDNGGTIEYLVSYPETEEDTEPTATYSVDFDRLCVGRIDCGFWTFHIWYNLVAECPRPTQLILSSAQDDALKEARFFDVYTREVWNAELEDWEQEDYTSELWSGALHFDLTGQDKRMPRMDVLAYTPADQEAGNIRLSVGFSNYPADPIGHYRACPITWFTLSTKEVPCRAATSAPVPWRFMVQGRYLYFRLTLTGDAVALSQILANVEALG